MSSFHILEKTGNSYRIVFHIAIPNANNSPGVSYRTALINSDIGGTTVLKDGDGTAGTIDATEKANIANGSVMEVVQTVDVPAGLTGQQTMALITATYNANSTVLLSDLQAKLSQFGRTG